MPIKQLLLLRHAKSSWDDPELDDFDRPLSARGLGAAPLIGRELASRDWLPDRALVSPALRTRDTWRLVCGELPEPSPETAFVEALYEASAETVLAEIRKTPETVDMLLVVGHNPGLQDAATLLAGAGSDQKAMRKLSEKFPTGAVARLVFDGAWKNLASGEARLTHAFRPKAE